MLASGSADIRIRADTPIPTDTRIRTMDTDTHIGHTDIMDRHFTGTVVIEFTTRGRTIDAIITGTGTKLKRPRFFEAGG
jgi:hypothetical protein